MAYYHDLITEQSFAELKKLKTRFPFVLIGGWATYFYTHGLKSKDIDIIVAYETLPLIRKHYDCMKNDRLKKYEAVRGSVQIDIYLPHYSKLGIPVEDLLTQTRGMEGFTLLELPHLIALKIHTLRARGHSAKGMKDFLDILSLMRLPDADLHAVRSVIDQYELSDDWTAFLAFFRERSEASEIGLSKHAYARLRNQIEEAA
jgi:hypothetical protein